MTIFVSIASFCEPYLKFTLDGLFKQAAHPQALRVAVIDQSSDDNRQWLRARPYYPRVCYLQLQPIDSRGVSWARSLAQSFYCGEDYFLQIDSHTRFEPNWDEKLLQLLAYGLLQGDKPIISTYPPSFEFAEDGRDFVKYSARNTYFAQEVLPDSDLQEAVATLRFRVRYEPVLEPKKLLIEGFHLAAGFLFTLGSFIEEVPYDPRMYFHGEEQNLVMRAYTRGWRIWHPQHPLIPLQHLYKMPHQAHRSHHWHPDYEAERSTKWPILKRASFERLCDLVYRRSLSGIYGLGTERGLDDFARLSGIDYPNKKIIRNIL